MNHDSSVFRTWALLKRWIKAVAEATQAEAPYDTRDTFPSQIRQGRKIRCYALLKLSQDSRCLRKASGRSKRLALA